jgi:hypothetical protein
VDDDRILFDWVRHYAVLVALFVVLGAGGAALHYWMVPAKAEAWTLVVEKGSRIPARQLGPLSEAIFRSAAVYRPAMQELGISVPPQRFFGQGVDLRPVPDTNTLIVVGRAGTFSLAARFSSAMARSLVAAFRARGGFKDFALFDQPQPAPVSSRLSFPAVLGLAGSIGLWVGLAVALLHFRIRRPVLSLQRALAVLVPDRTVVVAGVRPAWLGMLRPRGWDEMERNRRILRTLVDGDVSLVAPSVVVPGTPHRTEARLAKRWARVLSDDGWGGGRGRSVGSSPTVIVCDPATEISEMILARSVVDRSTVQLDLVWVR